MSDWPPGAQPGATADPAQLDAARLDSEIGLQPVAVEPMGEGALQPELRARLKQVLTDWGLDALTADPPHGWRCQYPESYGQGPCDCEARLLDDLVKAAEGA